MLAKNNVGGLVSEGIIVWTGSVCPNGYSRLTTIDGKFLVGDVSHNVAAGGSANHTHAVAAHTHSISSGTTGSSAGVGAPAGGPGVNAQTAHTHGGGSGTSGSGGSGTSDSQSNSPLFADVLLCKKD